MRIGDDELDAAQAPPRQLAQEFRPDRLSVGGPDLRAQHLAAAVGVVDGDRDDAPTAPNLEKGGIERFFAAPGLPQLHRALLHSS